MTIDDDEVFVHWCWTVCERGQPGFHILL